jgi:putative transposase
MEPFVKLAGVVAQDAAPLRVRHNQTIQPQEERGMFYHVWFSPRGRKWLLQGDVEQTVKRLLPEVAQSKGIELLACETMVDHVHLLLRLNTGQSLSKAMNLLKGISARRVLQQFPELALDAHLKHFWQKRYGYKSVPPEAVPNVVRYIQSQWKRLEKFDRYLQPGDGRYMPHP